MEPYNTFGVLFSWCVLHCLLKQEKKTLFFSSLFSSANCKRFFTRRCRHVVLQKEDARTHTTVSNLMQNHHWRKREKCCVFFLRMQEALSCSIYLSDATITEHLIETHLGGIDKGCLGSIWYRHYGCLLMLFVVVDQQMKAIFTYCYSLCGYYM